MSSKIIMSRVGVIGIILILLQSSTTKVDASQPLPAFIIPSKAMTTFTSSRKPFVYMTTSDNDDDDNNKNIPKGMTPLPSNVVKYSQVPANGKYFTATTIPKGLLNDHTTKAGTWGIINVIQGLLEYTIQQQEEFDQNHVYELNSITKGVIIPQVLHHVKALSDDVEFVVEFYRIPGTGPVDEKREGL